MKLLFRDAPRTVRTCRKCGVYEDEYEPAGTNGKYARRLTTCTYCGVPYEQ